MWVFFFIFTSVYRGFASEFGLYFIILWPLIHAILMSIKNIFIISSKNQIISAVYFHSILTLTQKLLISGKLCANKYEIIEDTLTHSSFCLLFAIQIIYLVIFFKC